MKQLERALTQLGISSDSSRIEKFRIYMEGILNWNKMVNLTSITDPEEFIEKHYMVLYYVYPMMNFKIQIRLLR